MEEYSVPRPAHRRPWSSEDDAALREMIAQGEFIGNLALALGRTREAVRNRANLLGLSVRTSSGRGRRRLTPPVAQVVETPPN